MDTKICKPMYKRTKKENTEKTEREIWSAVKNMGHN